jgi:hypothetical protein
MYLRNFADERGVLRLVDRDDLSRTIPSTVNNACKEVGFYEWRPDLKPDEVDDPSVLDPEHIEGLLSVFEGRATAAIARILNTGQPPRTVEDRYNVVHFLALQAVRGRRFREDLSQAGTWAARRLLLESLTYEQIEERLVERCEPHEPEDVEAFIDSALGPRGPRLLPDKTFAIQQALGFAFRGVAPRLWSGSWHVFEFDEPALVTSDEPVVAWHPDDEPVTAMTAPVVWLPLGRRHLLEVRGDDTERADTAVRGGRVEADRVNSLVATQAEQWILHHPEDGDLLSHIKVGPRTHWAEQVLGTRLEGEWVREMRRVRRLPKP